MDQSPYEPPRESEESSQAPQARVQQTPTLVFRVSQIVCYGWLVLLFLMWQMDGVNFLIQKDIGRLVSISSSVASILIAAFYVRLRHRDMMLRCIAYASFAGLMQLGILNTIADHSVDRFPM